jgi:HlyD family secretion protein
MQQSRLLSGIVLFVTVAAPLGIMGLLATNVLWPALKNPESKIYSSKIGYPALQRLTGSSIQVQTSPVQPRRLSVNLSAPGESVALQQVGIRPMVTGAVDRVFVVEGEIVRRGQPLLQLQKAPIEDAVSTARNDLAVAETNLQSLQLSAPTKLAELKVNMAHAQARFTAADERLRKINDLAEQELKNNIESAQTRLATAKTKLDQLQALADEGAVAKFQLYDMQDTYAIRKRELLAAEQGALGTQSQLYGNQDLQITRQDDMMSTQLELARIQKELEKQIAAARLDVLNKRIELQKALRSLRRTTITATTDGLVSDMNIHSGEIADANSRDPVITLTQNIVFRAYIDQVQLNSVEIGDAAIIRLVAYPGRTYAGKVIRLNPTVETTSKAGRGSQRQYTYSAWIQVESLQMPPGLQGFVQFDRGKTDLVIPESAVTHLSGGEGIVMVVEAGQAAIRKVKLGRLFDNKREVLGGLKAGERVVMSPRALNPGDKLKSR